MKASNKASQELKILRAKTKENEEVMQLLYSLAKDIAFQKNMDVLMDRVVQQIAKVMRVDDASLLLYNHETGTLDFSVIKGLNAQAMRELDMHLKPGEGLAGWVFVNNQHAIANETPIDPRFKQGVDLITGFRTKSLLAVPVRTETRNLGVLEVINRAKKDEFTSEDAEFLISIANLIATAIEGNLNYRELEISKEYVNNILENMAGGFIGIDMKQRICYFNSRASEILSMPKNVIGHNYAEILSPHSTLANSIEKTFADERSIVHESFTAHISKKGEREIGYSTLLIRNRINELQGVGVMFQDITEYDHCAESNEKK